MFWSAKSDVLVIMKIEQIGIAAFRQQAESGGVDEFVVQRFGGVYHLFAVNRRAVCPIFYRNAVAITRRGCLLTVPLRSCQDCVSRFTVRFEDNKHAEKDDRGH